MICPVCNKKFRYTKLSNVSHAKGFSCPLCGVKIISHLSFLEKNIMGVSTGIFVSIALYASYFLTKFILSPLGKVDELTMLLFIFPFLVFVYIFVRISNESIKMYRYNKSASKLTEKKIGSQYSFSISSLIIFTLNLMVALFFLLKEYVLKFLK